MNLDREEKVVIISEESAGERVDTALAKLLNLSRSVVADLLNAGDVVQGKKPLSKSDRVSVGDRIKVKMPAPFDPLKFSDSPVADLEIVYQDDDLVVVNKPVGVAAHPSPGWLGPTVLGGLIAQGISISTSGAQERQGIVQRLDVGTSGLMLITKNERSYAAMKDQFRNREVKKVYHALVQGHMEPSEGTIDAPIGRHPREDYRFAVVADGKPSITHYSLIEYFAGATLLRIELETGRTHQIRVHFNALRHPLVGDLAYGGDPVFAQRLELRRPWLHAIELSLIQPLTGATLVFHAAYPSDLKASLELLAQP